MKKIFCLIVIGHFFCSSVTSQKINTDSLLVEGLNSLKSLDYDKAIQQGRLGVKLAPEYTDFHMLLGRAFMKTNKIESAQFYFNHVMTTAPVYKDAFINSINLDNSMKNYENALLTVDKAIIKFRDEKEFYLLKLKILQLKDDHEAVVVYLNEMVERYPGDNRLLELLRKEKSKFISDRIGIDHSYSIFSRENVGPWNLTGIQYVRERKNTTIIGRLNYADRRANSRSQRSGYQFELESYIKTGANGTSISNIAYSNDSVFPKLRLSYSYLHNFSTGWEIDAGGRYIKPNGDTNIYAAAVGIGKYFGSSWVNPTSFLFFEEDENYLALGGTYRYYFNTKYDYFAILTGYGSSPDESLNLTPFTNQVSLDSYRAGIAFNKIFRNKMIIGIQFIGNRQEYVKDKFQNQFDFFASLQYKL
jgi:YaiO family outer membrane protein